MIDKIKLAAIAGTVASGLTAIGANAAIIDVPTYEEVVNTTSTAFAQSLVTDLLPWVAVFIAIIVGTLALIALYRKVVGGFKRLFGGGRKRRGGRRRR